MKTPKILLVDDEEATLFGYSRFLTKAGYSIETAKSLKEAKSITHGKSFDAVLLDLKLPDGNAIDWIAELKSAHQNTAIIVITGVSDIATAVKAIKLGANNFLTKPLNMEDLNISIKKGLEFEELKKRDFVHQRLNPKNGDPYFGSSPVIEKVIQYANVAAMNHTVVLLCGETGTGKGILARWIHDHSARKNEAFVEVNCSSLKGELLRSELFGHAKGAFTSAIKDRSGLIEVADGGTLFLDEIGDMDLEVQTQLLKTIEEKSYRRIGENKVRTSDFRLICATNRNLTEASNKGTFRKDLYYRINIFPISLPSLRERREDLPGLIKHMLMSFGYDQFPLQQSVIDTLVRYEWPGNIRELRNMLERALLLSQGKSLNCSHFPGLEGSTPLNQDSSTPEVWNLDDLEKLHIVKALKHFGGDKYETSNALGISLSSLYRKLDKMQQHATA
ncbi:sigma-54 dependent transcriptional regulator [Chitinispirillales bacterium ANBcel5]|uniref:sigma-54-dependent transcriptional regulator n=1 Tax=Cellulosispirillum alkaliphilum TaxID=3039283 RepID=UPI002A5338AE|nr:sigma-54 dependent transcriptional regulator [Chitinispirillales bacterium ANBcel5]